MSDTHAKSSLLLSFRLLLCILLFFAFLIIFSQRSNLSIAVICMINHTAIRSNNYVYNQNDEIITTINSSWIEFDTPSALNSTSLNLTSESIESVDSFKCKLHVNNRTLTDGPFSWSKKIQGFIHSSFYYGNVLSMIPGGWLTVRFGGKKVLCLVILTSSIFTLLTPLAARTSYIAMIICRFLTGFFQGPCFPAIGYLLANWVPLPERSRLMGLTFTGIQMGSLVASYLGGIFCSSNGFGIDQGWTLNFYFFGVIGCVWAVVFFIFASDVPSQNKFTSKIEKEYLAQFLRPKVSHKVSTPWLAILSSRIVITLNICAICYNWGIYLYLTQIPSYISDVLKFDVKSNGLISSIPYITCCFFLLLSSFLGDILVKSKVLSVLNVRKLFTGLSMLVPVLPLIGLSFVKCSTPYIGVALLAVGYSLNGLPGSGGFFVNMYEIGGQFTGIIIGLVNTIGTLSGILAPFITGVITSNHKQEEWRIVFWITCGLYIIGFIFYTLFADVSVQPWATKNQSNEKEPDEKNLKINEPLLESGENKI